MVTSGRLAALAIPSSTQLTTPRQQHASVAGSGVALPSTGCDRRSHTGAESETDRSEHLPVNGRRPVNRGTTAGFGPGSPFGSRPSGRRLTRRKSNLRIRSSSKERRSPGRHSTSMGSPMAPARRQHPLVGRSRTASPSGGGCLLYTSPSPRD